MFRTAISSQVQDGKDVPLGSIGEVLLKTPSLTLGYWEDPEATQELFQDGAWTILDLSELGRIFRATVLSFLGQCGMDNCGRNPSRKPYSFVLVVGGFGKFGAL